MDLRQAQRQRRPVQQRPAVQAPAITSPQVATTPQERSWGISRKWQMIIGGLIILGILAGIGYSVFGIGSGIDRSKYQAVFLDNGQVYFGKLRGWSGSQAVLADVYYFQESADNPVVDEENQEATPPKTQTLVKFTEAIHRPTDKLIINKDAVLFFQNIEDDGQVVEAIKNNQDNKKD